MVEKLNYLDVVQESSDEQLLLQDFLPSGSIAFFLFSFLFSRMTFVYLIFPSD